MRTRCITASDTSAIPDLYQLMRDLDSFVLIQIMFDSNASDQSIIRNLKVYIEQIKQLQTAMELSAANTRKLKDIISNLETLIRYVPKRFDGTEEIRTITYCIDNIDENFYRNFYKTFF